MSGGKRFGLRRHFALAPWDEVVEVHFGEGIEAYVTPCGPSRVGVALLCEDWARAPYPELLARFPALAGRLSGAGFDSPIAGSGPLAREARARTRDRLVLAGDAAGSVDAITGEGLSLAFQAAAELGAALPEALARGGTRRALGPWERAQARRWRRYALSARLVLGLARRPRARRLLLRVAARHPAALSRMVRWALG